MLSPAKRRAGRRRGPTGRCLLPRRVAGDQSPAAAGQYIAIVERLRRRLRCSASASATRRSWRSAGREVGYARELVHGKASPVRHDARGLFIWFAGSKVRGRGLQFLARSPPPARRARADRIRRRRRGDGGTTPQPAGCRHPVPPRIGADARRACARAQLPGGAAVIQHALAQLLDGRDLTRDEARQTMAVIMAGEASEAQIAGFLVALRARARQRTRSADVRTRARARPPRQPAANGSRRRGGHTRAATGANTYNISTCGSPGRVRGGRHAVAKHGNRAASSQTGAADVLEALGFELELPERIERSIDELGFGFLFAQARHPAMRRAARPTRSLRRGVPSSTCSDRSPARPVRARSSSASRDSARTLADALVNFRDDARAFVDTAPAASTSSRRVGRISSAK